jgi:beta-galactosidase/beta-glucuronidase
VFAGSELVAQKGAQEWGQAGAQKTAQKWGQAGAQKSAQMHVQKSTQKRAQECSEVGQAGEGEHYDFLYKITMELKSVRLWSPSDPFLYTIVLSYGKDRVSSYCAFRTVRVQAAEHGFMRLFLNHKPLFLRGVLDQGYWPDGLMTAPADEALIFDIQAMKDLGFNLLRKHIKIESERWYYHCDRLGMLVWQDMVSGGSPPKPWHISYKPTFFRWSWNHCVDSQRHYDRLGAGDKDYRDEWLQTCSDAIRQLGNHPSVIVWGLFNEAWGQFDARQATDMVRKLDPSRPIDATSGWYDQACGDFFSVHNYFRPLEVYKDPAWGKRAFVISEFGGLSYHLPEHSSFATSYGYAAYDTDESYQSAVRDTIAQACALEQQGLAGFVYTQLSDIEEETNGILTYDRRMNKLGEGICL